MFLKFDWSAPVSSVHEEDESVIKHEEVPRFHAAIDEHVLESSGVNLSYFLLKRFSIPGVVTLDSDSKVRTMKNQTYRFSFFLYSSCTTLFFVFRLTVVHSQRSIWFAGSLENDDHTDVQNISSYVRHALKFSSLLCEPCKK